MTDDSARVPGQRSHAYFRHLLERQLDGELDPDGKSILQEHLLECGECREMLEAEQRLIERLRHVPRLAPPADLRNRILREAAREHQELGQALNEDARFASVFRSPSADRGEEEIGFFAGAKPQPRRRSLLNRYSPAMAMAFLVVAAAIALITGDYSDVKPLELAQSAVKQALNLPLGQPLSKTASGQPSSKTAIGQPSSKTGTELRDAETHSATMPAAPGLSDSTIEITLASAQPSAPLTGSTSAATATEAYFTRGFERFRTVMDSLARASSFELPEPAERARAVTAAIILRPVDTAVERRFDPAAFTEEIRQVAELRLGGRVAGVDRFVFDGHRYRCYTLEVPGKWFDRLAVELQDYRKPAEEPILQALAMGEHKIQDPGKVAYFAAPAFVLSGAVRASAGATDSDTPNPRKVRIFLVE